MFNWREFGYHSADFKGHPDAINHLVSATDNVVITACEDGCIRYFAYIIQPKIPRGDYSFVLGQKYCVVFLINLPLTQG
jgi:hypothetical protein